MKSIELDELSVPHLHPHIEIDDAGIARFAGTRFKIVHGVAHPSGGGPAEGCREPSSAREGLESERVWTQNRHMKSKATGREFRDVRLRAAS